MYNPYILIKQNNSSRENSKKNQKKKQIRPILCHQIDISNLVVGFLIVRYNCSNKKEKELKSYQSRRIIQLRSLRTQTKSYKTQ